MAKRPSVGSKAPDCISLQDGQGRVRIRIGTARSPEGSPYMNFYDENGKVRMTFLLDSKGDPFVQLGLESGTQVLSLGASLERGGGGITLWNSSGTCYSSIAVDADGFAHHVGTPMREASEQQKPKRAKRSRTN